MLPHDEQPSLQVPVYLIPCVHPTFPGHKGWHPTGNSQDVPTIHPSGTLNLTALPGLQWNPFWMSALLHFQMPRDSHGDWAQLPESTWKLTIQDIFTWSESPSETFPYCTPQLPEVRCKNRGDRTPLLKSKAVTGALGHTWICTRETALQDAKGNWGRCCEYEEFARCFHKIAPLGLTFMKPRRGSYFIHLSNWASRDTEKLLKTLVKTEKLGK